MIIKNKSRTKNMYSRRLYRSFLACDRLSLQNINDKNF